MINNEVQFFNERDGPYYPTLRLLHKCNILQKRDIVNNPVPDMLPQVQVDRGAIKFVMSGANIMCPGLTSAGGKLPEEIPNNAIVV